MPINTQDMLLQTKPLSPLNLDIGGGGGMSLERERLRLMREQFENTKRQQEQQMQLSRMEEQGRMARERMQQEGLQKQREAQQQAEIKKTQDALLADFTKLNGSGDVEGARAMIPALNRAGLPVSLEGEENGLPRYRIGADPEAAAREAGAIGYPTDDSGTMNEPAGIPTTEEAFRRGKEASATAEATGAPARAPDQPDYTGAVPKNVMDLGAQKQATLAMLNPALSGMISAYPEEYRGSAEQTASAVRSLPLGAVKSTEMFNSLRNGPNSLIQSSIAADAQRAQAQGDRSVKAGTESERRVDSGYEQARKLSSDKKISEYMNTMNTSERIKDILRNDDKLDDVQVANFILELSRTKGAQSDKDVARALGLDAASTIDQIMAYVHKKAVGGFSTDQINSLLGFAEMNAKKDKELIFSYLDNVDEQIAHPEMDRSVGIGWQRYRDAIVPRALREEHAKLKGQGSTGTAGATSSRSPARGGSPALAEAAAGGYSPSAMPETRIPESSRIAFVHNNPGNLVFAGQEGAEQGEPKEGGGHWAKFADTTAGLEALRQQVLTDAERGLSIRDFITKYAPPDDGNDTDRYIEDAVRQLKAKSPEDALAETDPYDVVRFIAGHESGTKLPDQYSKSGDDDTEAESRLSRYRRVQ